MPAFYVNDKIKRNKIELYKKRNFEFSNKPGKQLTYILRKEPAKKILKL